MGVLTFACCRGTFRRRACGRVVGRPSEKHPNLKVACLGGPNLQAAGAQLLYDMTAVSIVGFVEVAKHYGFFKGLFNRTDWIEKYRPLHICFVDYPGFNLRLADQLVGVA